MSTFQESEEVRSWVERALPAPSVGDPRVSWSTTMDHLLEARRLGEPGLFAEYVVWADSVARGRGDTRGTLVSALRAIQQDAQSDDHQALFVSEIGTIVDDALAALGSSPPPERNFLSDAGDMHAQAQSYFDALMAGDRRGAAALIHEAADGGASVRDIYLRIFQPVLREVGYRWQLNRLSVAMEHYATAATQLIMSQLYDRIFSTKRSGKTMVACCAGGETHEIGLRMVSDFFEMEGWDTYYLGADLPPEDVVSTLCDRRADALAVSATVLANVPNVRALLEAVRRHPDSRHVVAIVGGDIFNRVPSLWRDVGADGSSVDALECVEITRSFLVGGERS